MKLLVFHPIIAPYRIDFFNRLSADFEIKVCLSWRNLHDQQLDYTKIEEQLAFKPEYIDRKRFACFPKSVWKNIRKFDPDIVLVSECGLLPILVLIYRFIFRMRYKVVSIIDDSYNMVAEDNHFTKKHAYAERILIPYFDEVINVEPRVAALIRRKYGKGLWFPIISNEQIARERYKSLLPASEKLVYQYSLIGKKVLLFVGRLVEIKNVQMVISAFMSLPDEEYRFVIVGSGEYEDILKEMSKDDTRIIFTGHKEGNDLYAWYNIAQVFALPSYQEPFGAVTNEALLAGCKSLVSVKAGSSCLITEENGRIFDPSDIKCFIQLLSAEMSMARTLSCPLSLKDNLMRESFDSCINHLIHRIMSL